ncbi:MAG TPA: chorismate-binding protein [Chryseosolibacter sp.]
MNTLAAVSSLKHSERELLSFLLSLCEDSRTPLALWRLPGSETKHLIISENCRTLKEEDLLEDLEPGFLMAPFDKRDPRLFLPADFFFSFEKDALKRGDSNVESRSAAWLEEKLKSAAPTPARRAAPLIGIAEGIGQESFVALVQRIVSEIESGTFEKVVPSRTRVITLPESFDIVHAFQRLCSSYPQALISFVSIPGVGTWLGASPEVLVAVQDKRIFKTVALAGTQPYDPGMNIKSVAWTQKEIEEQALVERYVISCFKKIRLREYEEHGPRTVIAGNLMHLKSEFQVDMKATNFPQLGSVMLQLLHPTAAVCGMPQETSFEFLSAHEGYHRGFYSGYLGPVNVRRNIDLFVNLRCMQISGNQGILYAGAGVTIDSVPEKEWEETEMKFNTLLNVIL